MKIALTGANGHIGSLVYKDLLEKGYSVHASDRNSRPETPGPVSVLDLTDSSAAYAAIAGCDVLIHLAVIPWSVASLSPQPALIDNTAMTMNIFQAALENKVSKIIFASSIHAVLGAGKFRTENTGLAFPYLPADGDSPFNSYNSYGLSKQLGEVMLQYFVKMGIPSAVALRFPKIPRTHPYAPNAYPPEREKESICQISNHIPQLCSYLLMQDIVSLVEAYVRADIPGFRVRMPAAPDPLSERSVQELIDAEYSHLELRKPKHEITSLVDISAILEETDWKPTPGHPFPDHLKAYT